MLTPQDVAQRVQARTWPIICNPDAPHEERVMAFLEMSATIATYCDVTAPYVEEGLHYYLVGDRTEEAMVTAAQLLANTNSLHIIADAMATGVNLKQLKSESRKDNP